MMKSLLLAVGVVLVSALAFELAGIWWAMPMAGALGGYFIQKKGPGFLAGALGVTAVWGMFLAMFAVISPLDRLLRVFAGIVEIGDAMAFVPVLVALLIAFLMGGLGGLSGALVAGMKPPKI